MRKCARFLLWPVAIVFVLFGFQITLLAFPQVLFSDSKRVGRVVAHHDGMSGEQAVGLAGEIDRRLEQSRFHDPDRSYSVFVFSSRKKYERNLKLLFMKVVPPPS